MLAEEIISEEIPSVSLSDTVEQTLDLLDINKVSHLAVVDEGEYLGVISENILLSEIDEKKTLRELRTTLQLLFVKDSEHLFEAVRRFGESPVSIVPVLNEDNKYVGVIMMQDLIQVIGKMPVIESPGSVLILEMNSTDYSLTEIARLIEGNDAKVLGSFITKSPDTTKIELTLKINKNDIRDIIQTFERYDYTITASHQKSEVVDDMKERYDSLMNYLNM